MTIACGIDGSAASREAALAAAAVARRAREPLLLVHVQETLIVTPPAMAGAMPIALANTMRLEAERERARQELDREAERLAEAFGIEVQVKITAGLPDQELIRTAEEADASLLVVASVGRRAATMWRFGSVADRLSQVAPMAVLVVRDARPLERWALEDRPLKALLALGNGKPTQAVVRAAGGLAGDGPCELIEAHVYHPAQEARRLGLSDHESPDSRRTIEGALARDLPGRFGELKGSAPTRFVALPASGHVAEALAELATEEKVDLVLMGRHGWGAMHRRFLGSVSYALLPMLDTNALIVPATSRTAVAAQGPVKVRSVLVATDLSETGNHALGLAAGVLAEGGRLILFHVEQPFHPPAGLMASYSSHREESSEERRLKRHLAEAELRKIVPEDAGLSIETLIDVVEAEDVPRAILEAAERHAVDLVCMGTHRYGRVAAALIGSIARSVARRSPRPVLMVPPTPLEQS